VPVKIYWSARAQESIEGRCSVEHRGAGSGDRLVLIAVAATDPDCTDDRSTAPQWNAAGEDHHASVIGCVDAKELLAWLAVFGGLRSLGIERPRGERLIDRDIDAAGPGPSVPTWLRRFPPLSTAAVFIG
jgi:hypothetical protein